MSDPAIEVALLIVAALLGDLYLRSRLRLVDRVRCSVNAPSGRLLAFLSRNRNWFRLVGFALWLLAALAMKRDAGEVPFVLALYLGFALAVTVLAFAAIWPALRGSR